MTTEPPVPPSKPLPVVSKEPEVLKIETPFRELIRRVKETDPKLGSEVSLGADQNFSIVEPVFRTGKRVKNGGRKGHETKYGTPQEKAALWLKYQEFIALKHKENPRLSYAQLQALAANHFDCHPKTIQRNTKNPHR